MEKRNSGQQPETVCIRTTRVHDWCTKQGSVTLYFTDLIFPADTARMAGVDCDVITLDCAEVERRQSGNGVASVTLRKQATLVFTFVDADGVPMPVGSGQETTTRQTRTRFWDEFVRICAPEQATIAVDMTECACRTSLPMGVRRPTVAVELFDCATIESAVETKLMVDILEAGVPGVAEVAAKPFAGTSDMRH
ncbi:MAG TPA: hypothetical protein VK464_19340 [Symbiobacteriaceae bacterium]|jgi:hypothetical protein|nr:hypothetical protein [Symbiobacteriaceae bacterium]